MQSTIKHNSEYTIKCVAQILDEPSVEQIDQAIKADMNDKIAKNNMQLENGLFTIYSILASTGWNANDEFFLAEELINSKDTVVNQPFNLNHQPDQIIGHIVSSYIVDDNLNEINEEQAKEQGCNILVGSVIYNFHPLISKSLHDKSEKIIEEIKNGQWFVSLECLGKGFDIALGGDENSAYVIKLEDKTMFLTKYLKVFGGPGVFNGRRIGRVVRNIKFVGMGLVKNPANKKSIIVKSEKVNTIFDVPILVIRSEDNMADQEIKLNAEEYTQLKIRAEKADELQKSLAEAHQALEDVKQELEGKKQEVMELGSKVAELTDKLNKNNEEFAKLHDELSKNKEQLASVGSELNRMKRMVKLVEAGIDKTQAEQVVDKLANVDDEAFDLFVEQEKKLAQRTQIQASENDDVDKDSKKDDTTKAMASDDDVDNTVDVTASTEDDQTKDDEPQEEDIVAKATKVFLS